MDATIANVHSYVACTHYTILGQSATIVGHSDDDHVPMNKPTEETTPCNILIVTIYIYILYIYIYL